MQESLFIMNEYEPERKDSKHCLNNKTTCSFSLRSGVISIKNKLKGNKGGIIVSIVKYIIYIFKNIKVIKQLSIKKLYVPICF